MLSCDIGWACRQLRRLMCCLCLILMAGDTRAQAPTPEGGIHLRVVGGLASLSQYVRFEQPFWENRIQEISGGRITAEIAPFDRSGLRAPEILPLMRLGVVGFGNALLGAASGDEPEFNIVDLPALNPDFATLRRNTELLRPYLRAVLAERHNVELLGVYTLPAQVLFCVRPFSSLADLAGRKVRTSSVGQSELVEALGGVPVVTAFADIVNAIRTGVVECAITGTLSGYLIGLHEVTNHVHAMAISWGISVFGASRPTWASLPEDVRRTLREAVTRLEDEIWAGAERETGEGMACNAGPAAQGLPPCQAPGQPGRMRIVPVAPSDAALRERLLRETVLPRWIGRCGPSCADLWNTYLAEANGFRAQAN